MDQGLVNVHKQLQSLCAAPKEMLCVRYLGAGFCALTTASSEEERERSQSVCTH